MTAVLGILALWAYVWTALYVQRQIQIGAPDDQPSLWLMVLNVVVVQAVVLVGLS